MFQQPKTLALTALALLALQACGDGPYHPPRAVTTTAADVAVASAHAAETPAVLPLLDDEGRFMPGLAEAEPTDPGVVTRTRRYATAAQGEQLLKAMGDSAVRIEAGCCGAAAVASAVDVVQGVRSLHELDEDAPVLVYGADQRLAATLTNALGDAGLTRVWLVTDRAR